MSNPQPQQIKIEIPEKEGEGIYSNFSAVGFNNSEFIMDFIRIMPGIPKGKVYSRIVMNPQNVKAFLKSLEDTVKQYEDKMGEIKIDKRDLKIGF